MGCARSRYPKGSKYVRVSDDHNGSVLLEYSERGNRGFYWFSFAPGDLNAGGNGKCAPLPEEPETSELAPRKEEFRHRFYDRTKAAVAEAKATCKRFREERYGGGWTRIHGSDFLRLYRSSAGEYLATCACDGVTAHEVCTEFWDTREDFKFEWDTSLEKCTVVEQVSPTCSVVHLLMKKIWPVAQRDCVMCSEIVRLGGSTWGVCNYSLADFNSPLAKPSNGIIRSMSSVSLLAEDHLIDIEKGHTRDNIRTEITYQAVIDPGGWLPPNFVNAVGRREWEKALRSLCDNTTKRVRQTEEARQAREDEDNELFFDGEEMNVFN